MDDQATNKVSEAFSKLEFITLKGKYGTKEFGVWLTPESVKYVNKGPWFWKAYAKFKINPQEGVRVLKEDVWEDKYTSKVNKNHIYDGGLKFPEICPVCLAEETEYYVIEARLAGSGGLGKNVVVEKVSQEKANRIFTATNCDRFWYVLCFSEHHGVEDRAVYFERIDTIAGQRFKLVLTNREYAKQFAEFNHIVGRWMSSKNILIRLLGVFGFIPFIGMAALAGVAIYYEIAKKEWNVTPMDFKTNMVLFVTSLIASIALVYITLKANKGEPIK